MNLTFIFANVGINSSVTDAPGVDTYCEDFTYSDYLNNPTVHRIKFDLISENDIIVKIKQMEELYTLNYLITSMLMICELNNINYGSRTKH